MQSFVTSIEPGQHSHMCSLTRLYTVGCLNSIFHTDFHLIACKGSRQQFAALCQYFIVFLESIIEALILLMKNKFTYIKTIVLLFPCKYNTFLFETCDKTEIQFMQLCEDKLCVYSRQQRALAPVWRQASVHIHAVWPGSILLAAKIHIFILISLKFTMNCAKIKFRQVHCLNLPW